MPRPLLQPLLENSWIHPCEPFHCKVLRRHVICFLHNFSFLKHLLIIRIQTGVSLQPELHFKLLHGQYHTLQCCSACVITTLGHTIRRYCYRFNRLILRLEMRVGQTDLWVNSGRPSSGCRGCFPLSAATTTGLRPGVALPPASPLSRG